MNTSQKKPSPFRRRMGLPAAILLSILAALLVWLPLPLNCSCTMGIDPPNLLAIRGLWDGAKPDAYVAHALGEIDGNFYTNSRDAFLQNYENGFRAFEVDLVLLGDGSAFCAHDGSEWMYGLDKPFIETTAAELAGRLCLEKYAPLTGSDLVDLMNEYSDACFLLDTKRTGEGTNHAILEALVSEARERHPSVLDRMVPHTFGPADSWETAKIHHFTNYWVAVYSFRPDIDGSSSTDADRVVLYAIANAGPTGLPRTADVRKIVASLYGTFPGAFSRLRRFNLGLTPFLGGIRLCVSLDIIDTDAAPALS